MLTGKIPKRLQVPVSGGIIECLEPFLYDQLLRELAPSVVIAAISCRIHCSLITIFGFPILRELEADLHLALHVAHFSSGLRSMQYNVLPWSELIIVAKQPRSRCAPPHSNHVLKRSCSLPPLPFLRPVCTSHAYISSAAFAEGSESCVAMFCTSSTR